MINKGVTYISPTGALISENDYNFLPDYQKSLCKIFTNEPAKTSTTPTAALPQHPVVTNNAVSVEETFSDFWDKYSDGGTITKAWFDRIIEDFIKSKSS